MSNIAFLSTAHIHTRSFLENISKASDGRRTRGIWDDVEARGRRYADEFGTVFEPDLDQLLTDPSIDGFVICAENTRHLPLLEKALPVGKPVFCEKPLVTSREELSRVRLLHEANPVPLFCGYFQPFDGVMQRIAELVAVEAFGTITRIRYRNAHHAAYGRWFDNADLNWFYQPELSGGGAFMDMGTHALHLVRSLFGPVDQVWATIANHSGIYPGADDYGLAELRFESGILGTVEAAWTQTGGIGGLEITGSERTLWNTGNGYVFGAPGSEPEPIVAIAPRPTRMDRLVAAIHGDLAPEELSADLAATRDAVVIMEAAYRSSDAGTWETVN
jgi:predicted dehydrogenase